MKDIDFYTMRIRRTAIVGGIIAILAGAFAAWLGAQIVWTKEFMGIDQYYLDRLAPPGWAWNFLYVVPGALGVISGVLGVIAGFIKQGRAAIVLFVTAGTLSCFDIFVFINIGAVILFFCGALDIKKGRDSLIENEAKCPNGEY